MNQGWECPKCGRVYAPVVLQCSHCKPTNLRKVPDVPIKLTSKTPRTR